MTPAAAWAQGAAQNVEVEPVTCWWRTTTSSIRMGEPFELLLTCSALESEAAKAVIDRARLGSASVQFPPYEVMGGSQGADHVTPSRRFMQYRYTLRLINESAFGTDVAIPEMPISYRLESQTGDASIQGREQAYVLPAISMRVASLVPDSARHIRESGLPTFDQIASREFRARLLRIIALTLFGVAALTAILALVRWFRERRVVSTETRRQLLPNRAVLAGVRRELASVQQQARGGWTPELLNQALAATRIVASYVVDHPVAQRASATAAPGELAIAGGWIPRRRAAVAGSTTPVGLARLTHSADAGDLQDALAALTSARYRPADKFDDSALDGAITSARRAADRVSARYTIVAEMLAAIQRSARSWRPQAWAR